jgi:hypothetical protein
MYSSDRASGSSSSGGDGGDQCWGSQWYVHLPVEYQVDAPSPGPSLSLLRDCTILFRLIGLPCHAKDVSLLYIVCRSSAIWMIAAMFRLEIFFVSFQAL